MKKIEKKAYRKVPLMVQIALIAVLISIIVWGLSPHSTQKPVLPEAHETPKESLYQLKKEDVLSFSFFPSRSEPYHLIRQENQWVIEKRETVPLDPSFTETVVETIINMDAEKTSLTVNQEKDLEIAGMDASAFRFTIHASEGREIHVRIGGRVPGDRPLDYMTIDGNPTIYAIESYHREYCDIPYQELCALPSINFTPDLIDQFSITSGTETLVLCRKNDRWSILSPVAYPADPSFIQGFLNKIKSMRFATYEAEGTADNLKKFGLAAPQKTIVFNIAPSFIDTLDSTGGLLTREKVEAHQISLSLGNSFDHIGFFCLYQQRIYKATNLSMGFLNVPYALTEVGCKNPFDLPINRVNRLSIKQGTRSAEYTITLDAQVLKNNQIATDENGETIYDVIVQENGHETDSEAFIRRYLELFNLSTVGNLPADYLPQGEKQWIFVFSGNDWQQEVCLYSYDTLHWAVGINNTFLFYMDKQSIEQIEL